MELRLDPWNDSSLERMRALAAHPAMQPEFERMLGHGLDALMADVYNPVACRRVASVGGVDVGFGYALVPPAADHRFAAFRIGVLPDARRQGIGSMIHDSLRAAALEAFPDVAELEVAAILPAPAADAFATRHGYQPRRRYWMMERPLVPVPAIDWPAGVSVRLFDGSDRDVRSWTVTFNETWRDHDHPILATEEAFRHQIEHGAFEPEGMVMAERDGTMIGFVRLSRHETRGEIAVLGVTPAARGIGLGRALLRHGTQWLMDRGETRITLYVDGENERALRLYHQESYEITQTRQFWSRTP